MKLTQLLDDDDAVSPVIGVILMVAITVILAAVIGTFVLGLGDQVQTTAPNTQFSFDYAEEDGTDDWGISATATNDEGLLTMTHDGGDKINSDQLSVTGSSVGAHDGATVGFSEDAHNSGVQPVSDDTGVTAGTSVDYAVDNGDTVRIVWQDEDGSQTSTVARWNGPNA